MTWFGWVLVIDLVVSCGLHVATNNRRRPLDSGQLAWKVVCTAAYAVGVLVVGTGSL